MFTLEEVAVELDSIAEDFPAQFYTNLNGGICLLPDTKHNPKLQSDRYFVMGEYIRDPGLGNYIIIYYGSFCHVYGNAPKQVWRDKLREVLRHEFRHHMEGLAGVRDLEEEDARFIAEAQEREKCERNRVPQETVCS